MEKQSLEARGIIVSVETHDLESGQSLIEIVIALGIGAVLIVGAVIAITTSLKSGSENKTTQTGSFLTQELIDHVTVYARADWRNIWDLSKSPTEYHIVVSGSTFATSSGQEVVMVDGVSYNRYFILQNTSRDGSGNIEIVYNSANDDPSTQRVSVTTTWSVPGGVSSYALTKYLTRNRNDVFVQTDWSGGATVLISEPPEVITAPNNRFATSTNISTTTVGQIKITGF